MNAKIFIFIFSLLLLCIDGYSQQDYITWQAETVKNLRSNEQSSFSCTFKIYVNDRIDWIQNDVVYSFPMTSTQGILPNEGPGTVTYDLAKEGKSGKVIIERDSGGSTFLTLDLSEGSKLGAYFSFKISKR